MHPTLAGWEVWDFPEANRNFAAFGDAPGITEDDLLEALSLAPRLRGRFTQASHLEHHGHTISWFHYETLLWTLGEGFRRQLKAHRHLRRRPGLFDPIQALCRDPAYGKGRESFTMLLGQYGGPTVAATLLHLLGDPEVQGHALYALRLLGDPAGVPQARALLTSRQTWVRREAKKYLAKITAGTSE